MSKYKEIADQLTGSASAENGSRRYSKKDVVSLTAALLNEDDHSVDYYGSADESGKPIKVTKQPVHEYREALKPILDKMGIDKKEQDKIHDIPFDKKHAEALIDVAQVVQHDYVQTGKKLRLPMLSENETGVTLSMEKLPEKIEATEKNVIQDGKTVRVPTGKTIKTEARQVVKSGNKVPHWLKSEV